MKVESMTDFAILKAIDTLVAVQQTNPPSADETRKIALRLPSARER